MFVGGFAYTWTEFEQVFSSKWVEKKDKRSLLSDLNIKKKDNDVGHGFNSRFLIHTKLPQAMLQRYYYFSMDMQTMQQHYCFCSMDI